MVDGFELFGSSNFLIIIWYMYRRCGFFGGDPSPDPPKPEGSQDKRISKPKLEKGKGRKLKRKDEKKTRKCNFIVFLSWWWMVAHFLVLQIS